MNDETFDDQPAESTRAQMLRGGRREALGIPSDSTPPILATTPSDFQDESGSSSTTTGVTDSINWYLEERLPISASTQLFYSFLTR